jgi:hypothetical protein
VHCCDSRLHCAVSSTAGLGLAQRDRSQGLPACEEASATSAPSLHHSIHTHLWRVPPTLKGHFYLLLNAVRPFTLAPASSTLCRNVVLILRTTPPRTRCWLSRRREARPPTQPPTRAQAHALALNADVAPLVARVAAHVGEERIRLRVHLLLDLRVHGEHVRERRLQYNSKGLQSGCIGARKRFNGDFIGST